MTITETVTKKLKLFSRRKVVTLLSGNYDSLFRGRGLEIDNLREYVAGDDVKDIDWKATARTGTTHTRIYAALRDQRVVIVADTSRSMLLPGYEGLHKLDALYAITVMMGNFAKRNHDLLALCAAGGDGKTSLSRYNSGSRHLESILQKMDSSIHASKNNEVPLSTLYTRLLSMAKKRGAVFVVSDSTPSLPTLKEDLAKLSKRHQVFYIQLSPSSPFMPGTDDEFLFNDIETNQPMSADIVASSTLQKEWLGAFQTWYASADKVCKAHGVSHGLITKAEQVPEVLRKMFLQAKRYAQHRR